MRSPPRLRLRSLPSLDGFAGTVGLVSRCGRYGACACVSVRERACVVQERSESAIPGDGTRLPGDQVQNFYYLFRTVQGTFSYHLTRISNSQSLASIDIDIEMYKRVTSSELNSVDSRRVECPRQRVLNAALSRHEAHLCLSNFAQSTRYG